MRSLHIFRAYDIRGVIGIDIDTVNMTRIGRSLGIYLRSKLNTNRIIIGRDIRKTSSMLSLATISGLLEMGIDVYDIGVLPVGVLLRKLLTVRDTVGAYITASHLPPEYNGLKLIHGSGVYFSSDEIAEIKEIYTRDHAPRSWKEVGKYWIITGEIENYINSLVAEFSDLKSIGIVLDCGNGATCLTAPRIFKSITSRTIELNCNIDPYFRGRGAEPIPSNIVELMHVVKSKSMDYGVAYDGDGDRAIFVDYRGEFLPPEEVAIILVEGLGLRGSIVASIDCSKILEDYAESKGLKVYRSRVGHNFVIEKMIECNAIIGVERSGHIALSSYQYVDDGVLISLLLGRAILNTGREYVSLIESNYCMKSTKLRVKEELKSKIMNYLRRRIESMEEGTITLIDGIRLDLEDGWILIRPSNTEPVIRVTVEARDSTKLDKYFVRYVEMCRDTIRSLSK